MICLTYPDNYINKASKIMTINTEIIQKYSKQLDTHPVYEQVQDLNDLRCFMEHHVYSVWDFMSLIKFLQSCLAPTTIPWVPRGDGSVRRFINELVLEEESDQSVDPEIFSSHFELYLQAMEEIGADVAPINAFIDLVRSDGLEVALDAGLAPNGSVQFTATTFKYIENARPHEVSALLALGREHIIPSMFRAILAKIGIGSEQAPIFHFYLNRHIHLDEDFHAPLSLRMLNAFVDGDELKEKQAISAGEMAIKSRLKFWDAVSVSISNNRAS